MIRLVIFSAAILNMFFASKCLVLFCIPFVVYYMLYDNLQFLFDVTFNGHIFESVNDREKTKAIRINYVE